MCFIRKLSLIISATFHIQTVRAKLKNTTLNSIDNILELEDKGNFDKAFDLYSQLHQTNPDDFEIWKHFYFFLWIAIEDATAEFHDRINIRQRLQAMFDDGKNRFQDIAEFKFIAGWTVLISPYEYGDYEDLEKEGMELLKQAHEDMPDNMIYKMAYLGSFDSNKAERLKVEKEANSFVLKRFAGTGFLNSYFRDVLNRENKKA